MSDALPADGPDDFWKRTTSPDGRYVWIVDAYEARAAEWVMGGTLWRTQPPLKLFTAPVDWSFESRTFPAPDILELSGRCFPGVMPGIKLTLDLAALCGTIEAATDPAAPAQVPAAPMGAQPFAALLAWLAAYPRE